jgi:hypothetical protein
VNYFPRDKIQAQYFPNLQVINQSAIVHAFILVKVNFHYFLGICYEFSSLLMRESSGKIRNVETEDFQIESYYSYFNYKCND